MALSQRSFKDLILSEYFLPPFIVLFYHLFTNFHAQRNVSNVYIIYCIFQVFTTECVTIKCITFLKRQLLFPKNYICVAKESMIPYYIKGTRNKKQCSTKYHLKLNQANVKCGFFLNDSFCFTQT